MKKLITIVLINLTGLLFFTNSAKSNEPNIIWESEYEPRLFTKLRSPTFKLYSFDNNIYFTFRGENFNNLLLPGIIAYDDFGKLLFWDE